MTDRRPTALDRAAAGRAARKVAPRAGHAEYTPAPKRRDPIDVIEAQSATRVPELVPIRYARMTESPFRFYRGAAAIMAMDLAETPRSGISAQLCGDAHMLNFRLLASPERNLLFDINDFDETLPGPWEWDLKRLVTSLVIAGRQNGFATRQRRDVVVATARSYRESMRRFAAMRNLEVWYAKVDVDVVQKLYATQLRKTGRDRLAKAISKARSKDNLMAFDRLTYVVDGQRRITSDPPLLQPIGDLLPDLERAELEDTIRGLIRGYCESLPSERRALVEQFEFVDMARKVVGVGSVGTRCWIILMLGRDERDPLLLQVKEAGPSVLAEHVGPSRYANQGQRVVAGQRLMQAAGDTFLGWQTVQGIDGATRDFYVRQLYDWKGIAIAEQMPPEGMLRFGELCGHTLARAHARSGDRIGIAEYLGSSDAVDQALAPFAESYADQNERDHAALVEAVRTGRVEAASVP
ncbi:DUF2252 domain-containing protein [Virgisporangium aurantiacum]|uniref:DUF2252 domain-containing protein n=1 Tax=Virgisporangium aurantiacum TaxID=175570 RepID=A0A8J4E7F8_9ACTN|nr:DUF2252 domain-containing protein [Virgisporangium aurantiacum]GIJ64496.1 hypothetical protein Vau01_120120 [Virgisporangium aurantiacum]